MARRQFTQVGWTRHAVTDCHPARGCDTCLVCSSAVLAFYRCSGWLCLPACVALSDCRPLFAVRCRTVGPCLQCAVRLSAPVCSALSDCRSLFAVRCQTVGPCLQCAVRLSAPVCSALSDCRSLFAVWCQTVCPCLQCIVGLSVLAVPSMGWNVASLLLLCSASLCSGESSLYYVS